jgi:hypothetical protein
MCEPAREKETIVSKAGFWQRETAFTWLSLCSFRKIVDVLSRYGGVALIQVYQPSEQYKLRQNKKPLL